MSHAWIESGRRAFSRVLPQADRPAREEPLATGDEGALARRTWAGFTPDSAVAVATWLVGMALAVLLVRWFDLDPYTVGGVVMPMGVGAVAGAIVLALFLLRRSDLLIGVGIGVYSAWIALAMATTLHGSPYGFGLLSGDAGRFVAMAMKFTQTSASSDPFIKGMPSEYPPLYPWVVGHVARLVDRPAWQLFGDMQIVVMTGAVVLSYVLWRRLVSPGVAFAIAGLSPAVFAGPSKDYEFIALLVFTPWVLATCLRLPRERGGLHWLSSGIIGGLLVLTYEAWIFYAAAGIVALLVLSFRAAAARGRYLLHLLGVTVTAVVVASWYLVPFGWDVLTQHSERVSDLWMSAAISDHPLYLPFLQVTPLAAIQLAGLLGMLWYRRTTWWAQPLLLLVLGTYAYRVAFLLRTAYDNHTGYLQYTETLISMLFMVAGVLTFAEAVPPLWRRLSIPSVGRVSRERLVAVTVVVVLVVWAFVQGWPQWVPGPRGLRDSVTAVGEVNRGTDAHAEPLPDGSLVRFAPPAGYIYPRFPTSDVERVVTSQLGASARPVVLVYDQRLFAFTTYYGYTAVDRLSANSLTLWDARTAEIKKLAKITDPAQFATAVDKTPYGPIDVFVLHVANETKWQWLNVPFSPQSFDAAHFHIERLPDNAVIAVRKH